MPERNPKPVRTFREHIITKVPVLMYPPYIDRQRFGELLEKLPEGGLGFHATTSDRIDSIQKSGITVEHSSIEDDGRRIVHYTILDPQTDPTLKIEPNQKGRIATYHRMRRTISGLIEAYSLPKIMYGQGVESSAQAALIVFENARNLATISAQEKADKKKLSESPWGYYTQTKTDEEIAREQFDARSFMVPLRYIKGNSPMREDLEWGKGERIPPEAIVDIFILGHNESLKHFTNRVTKTLVKKYAV